MVAVVALSTDAQEGWRILLSVMKVSPLTGIQADVAGKLEELINDKCYK
jgi:hypothetical protein